MEIPGVLPPCKSPAFARKLFDALADNLCEIVSRDEGPGIWNGVFGAGRMTTSAGSSLDDWERMRGVALRVPHVISCFTAAGPSSEGVGEGIVGTREKLFIVGDLGRSFY